MKRLFSIVAAVSFSIAVLGQTVPEVSKTEFTPEALNQTITSLDGQQLPVSEVLKNYEGKILVVDFWASWCRDCIKALPETKILKENNPEIQFVYFSLDRTEEQWKKGLEKYEMAQNANYWFDEGWENVFNNYVELNWIPRFIVIDQQGKIAKYYAISPTDPDLQKTIEQLKSEKCINKGC